MKKTQLIFILLVSSLLLTTFCRRANPEPATTDTSAPLQPDIGPSPSPGDTYLPTVANNTPVELTPLQTADLQYVGAFRLPGGDERPLTFAYGGNALTVNPDGDPAGPDDGFPGSLFITGHERLAYGELPDGNQLAEVSIPPPVNSANLTALSTADFVQPFANIFETHFPNLDELPRVGLQYLDVPATGPQIHVAWGQHFELETAVPTHAWFDPDLDTPDWQGDWFIADASFYSINGYMLSIPTEWATDHANGRLLGTGRYRDGGWSGMGPALYAYRPWIDASGTPAAANAQLAATPLLLYESSENTENIERALNNYQHPDEWEGAAWIASPSGKTAVLFAGTKATGDKYWYGFANPTNPDQPCVAGEFVGQFAVCRLADGTPCPPEDLVECSGHNDNRGWWSTRYDAQIIFYHPDDLARVASGESASWEPQPYATLDIDDHLFLNPAGIEPAMLGEGQQRHFRIGDMDYDPVNGLLYVLELFADDAKPVVHIWRIP